MLRLLPVCLAVVLSSLPVSAAARRKVIIDEDCAGPGGTNMQAVLVMLQSAEAEVLGITVPSGDQWRDEEVQHVLRLLEIAGRTDIPVLKGAEFPLVKTREETRAWERLHGKVSYQGAWDARWWHEPSVVPAMADGRPSTKPSEEDAAHFLVRMVRQYPHQVTIYEGAPMTDLALAISIDPDFPRLAEALVFMGGSLNPQTADPEFANNPRHEFNFWFDPEAAQIVLRAPWPRIVCTPTDISIKVRLNPETVKRVGAAATPAARYIERFYQPGLGNDYMWDELAAMAWLDPSLIVKKETRYMSVNLDRGSGYGDTLTWNERDKPELNLQPVEIQLDLNREKFYEMFVALMTAKTPEPVQNDSRSAN